MKLRKPSPCLTIKAKQLVNISLVVSSLLSACAYSEDIGLPVLKSEDIGIPVLKTAPERRKKIEQRAPVPAKVSPQEGQTPPKLIPLTKDCIDKSSSSYGVHPDILYAILLVEGGTVGETNHGNKNGTKDLNLFQINEINLPELYEEFGITRDQVLNDGCLNAAIAARHLVRSVAGQPNPTTPMEYLRLLARYHSADPTANLVYALKLKDAFEFLNKNSD
jgi:hypothetical protein